MRFNLVASKLATRLRSVFGGGDGGSSIALHGSLQRTTRNQFLLPPLTVYDYEASPFCRRVRETLCALRLDAMIVPCPRTTVLREGVVDPERHIHRPAAQTASRAMGWADDTLRFPILVDHHSGRTMRESKAIVEHLWSTYAPVNTPERAAALEWVKSSDATFRGFERLFPGGAAPALLRRTLLPLLAEKDLLGLLSVSAFRPINGLFASPVRRVRVMEPATSSGRPVPSFFGSPPSGVELWATEACPRARLLREALCETQISFALRPAEYNCPRLKNVHGPDAQPPFLAFTEGEPAERVALSCHDSSDGDANLARALRHVRDYRHPELTVAVKHA